MKTFDLAYTGYRALRALVEVGRDEVEARLRGFPRGAESLDRHWLGRALGADVEGFEILDAHSGTTSRLRLRLEGQAGARRLPAQLFVKLTPRSFGQRFFLAATGIGRNEVRFYETVRPGLAVRSPEILGLGRLGPGRQFALLLEDIAQSGTRLPSVGQRADEKDARKVVAALATLHASLWESPRFDPDHGDLAWLPRFETRQHDLRWERVVTAAMVGRAETLFADDFDAPFREIVAACRDRRDRLEALLARGPRTFIHGDCHFGNLFFEGDHVGFFDWQVCGMATGMRDVGYFLCTSLPTALRREHEISLIRSYLEALEHAGVPSPSFEDTWHQYRLVALYAFIAAAFTAAAGDAMQSLAIGKAGLSRATAAAIDLQSVAALDDSPG
jgi:aminoglycoside phosphotransferase (APT) family kinase protein